MARETGAGSPISVGHSDAGAGAPAELDGFVYSGDTGAGSPWPSESMGLIPLDGFPSFMILSATAISLQTIVCNFSTSLDPVSEDDNLWLVTLSSSLGATVAVESVEIDGTEAVVGVFGALTPGATYTISVTGVTTTTGLVRSASRAFAVPVGFLASAVTSAALGPLNALLKTFARQLYKIAGVPHTFLSAPWTPGDARLKVDATYEFPNQPAGVLVGMMYMSYTSTTTSTFEGVVPQFETATVIPAGTKVTLVERAVAAPRVVGITAGDT